MAEIKRNIKRLGFDAGVFALILAAFVWLSRSQPQLENALYMMFYRGLLVSAGFMHAHITRKLAFGDCDWDEPFAPMGKKILVTALYVTIIYCYARGG